MSKKNIYRVEQFWVWISKNRTIILLTGGNIFIFPRAFIIEMLNNGEMSNEMRSWYMLSYDLMRKCIRLHKTSFFSRRRFHFLCDFPDLESSLSIIRIQVSVVDCIYKHYENKHLPPKFVSNLNPFLFFASSCSLFYLLFILLFI